MTTPDEQQPTTQPEPESSSDGDGSWTEDPITQDPDEDRSVEHVIDQTHGRTEGDGHGEE